MKFIADRMLGRLVRWLRLFGYDTLVIHQQENEDDLLLEVAEKEERILISRDRVLVMRAIKKGIRSYLVQSSEIMEQLLEMQKEFDIEVEPGWTGARCAIQRLGRQIRRRWSLSGRRNMYIRQRLKKCPTSGYAIIADRFTGLGSTGRI